MLSKLRTILCGAVVTGAMALAPAAQASSYLFTTTGADYSVSALFDQAGLDAAISSNSVNYFGTEAVTLTVSLDGVTRTSTFDAFINFYLSAQTDPTTYADAYLAIDDLAGGHVYQEVSSDLNAFTGITDSFVYNLVTGDYGHIDINGLADLINWDNQPVSVSLTTVPEPAALSLFALGLAGLVLLRRRRPA